MPLPTVWAAAEISEAAPMTEHQILIFLLQVALLVGVARFLGTVMKRLRQPPVVGELLAGVVLGASAFGLVWPSAYESIFVAEPVVNSAVFALSWLGVVFLLVVMGFETDLAIIYRFRSVALTVAGGSLVLPFLATGMLGLLLADGFSGTADPPPWVFASFFALALSVSALPVVGKILSDLGVMRRNFGQVTLAAAMAKDAVGWLILAVLSGVAAGALSLGDLAFSFGGLAVFVVVTFTLGRFLLDGVYRLVLARGSDVTSGLAIALVVGLAGGVVTQWLGVEAILGAYLIGLALSRIRHQLPQVRERLEQVTAAFFAPVFFAVSGLRVDITALADGETALWTLVAIVVAVVAKIGGTVLSGRLVGVAVPEGIALGSGLSPLGVMGVVVAIIGLNVGVLDDASYTVLLLAAVITSLAAPVMLKWAVSRWEPPEEEAERLERESLRKESEILGASRILLPTRGGNNSVYAARLVAAVFPDAEVTVLTIDVSRGGIRGVFGRRNHSSVDADDVVEALGDTPSRTLNKVASDPAEAILAESRLGYDLLVVGASRDEGRARFLASVVEKVLRETGIQTLVVQFPQEDDVPVDLPEMVLVPVSATRSSRAAEEFGYSVAGVSGGRAAALHVVNRPDGEGLLFMGGFADEGVRAARDLLAGASAFAGRLGVALETEAKAAPNAEQEILDFASEMGADLLVLGTSSRPVTNRPFFGHRISYLAENAPVPLVIVALPSVRGTG